MKQQKDRSPQLQNYYDNRDRNLQRQREYRKNNVATHQRTASLAWERKNPNRALWVNARRRAKKANLPFNIDPKDVVIPTHCPVSGVLLSTEKRDTTPSLDKIIPELGYVKGNVIIVSWRINRLKSDATPVELAQLAKFYSSLLNSGC